MSGKGPVFVIGAPRSGTSLMQYLLAAHPQLGYVDIGLKRMWMRRSIRLAERAGVHLTRSRRLHAAFAPRAGETAYEPTLKILGLDPDLPVEGLFLWLDRSLAEASDLRPEHLRADPALAARIRSRYASVMARAGTTSFVDKSPSFTLMLETIRELYPDAQIVHAIRDGRAVVNSVAYAFRFRRRADGSSWATPGQSWWGPRPAQGGEVERCDVVERACHQWLGLLAEGRRGRELFPGRYHEVRYERLVAATRNELRGLLDRLGLSTPHGDLYPARLENRNYKWQARGAASFGDAIWTDRAAIAPSEYGLLEVLRPTLEALGYVERGAAVAA